jgi:mannitol-specific phosphotransferase system IIBC component
MNDLTLTIIEIFVGIIIEGVILGLIFSMIANKSEEKMQKNLTEEMNTMEKQSKFEYSQLQMQIESMKKDLISQIKESNNASN